MLKSSEKGKEEWYCVQFHFWQNICKSEVVSIVVIHLPSNLNTITVLLSASKYCKAWLFFSTVFSTDNVDARHNENPSSDYYL